MPKTYRETRPYTKLIRIISVPSLNSIYELIPQKEIKEATSYSHVHLYHCLPKNYI